MWTGLNPGPSNTQKSDSSAKLPSGRPAPHGHFLSRVQTTLLSLLDQCNGLLPLSTLVSSQSTHCAVVFLLKTLPGSAMALDSSPSGPASIHCLELVCTHEPPYHSLPKLASLISLCAHHFPASEPPLLLFPLPGTPSLHQEVGSLLCFLHQVKALERLFPTV